VVVTDHNRIAGGLRAKELDAERVIVGEEIMTTKGELLCAFVQEEIPNGLEPAEAIGRLREQGAFISISHPFDRGRKGAWELADLIEITPLVDAIETFNSRCLDNRPNEQAAAFAREHYLPGTAGSDAHAPFELGRGNLLLPAFDSPESLKGVLREGQPVTRLSPAWVHFWSMYAKIYKRMLKVKI
ncbi:MAG TPA: PHP domain-containing protein, partial [Anaerolineaceae bacterium]|nr:PHP domain-containing protein [Anaerolineaceae bacterium]